MTREKKIVSFFIQNETIHQEYNKKIEEENENGRKHSSNK